MARLLSVASIALICGCGLTSREFRLALSGSDGNRLQLTVVDRVGIVETVTDGAPAELVGRARLIDFEVGDGRALDLGWVLFPCDRSATLTLQEEAGVLRLEMESTTNDQTCDAMAVGYGVRLDLAISVDSGRVCAYVIRDGQRHSEDTLRCP